MPRVSVVLPAWQAVSTLGAALESVRRQAFTDWECVVVDDGSTDGTGGLAERSAAADPRFVVVKSPHRGLVPSLNAGLARACGALIARMDADDLMRRERLGAQVALLDAAPGLAAAGCHVRVFPRAGLSGGTRDYERWIASIDSPRRLREDAFVECPVVHPTLMARREILVAGGGWRDEGWPEDYDLVLRLLAAGHEIGVVPRRLLSWRDSPGRLSRVDAAYGLDRFAACKAKFLAEGFLAGHGEYHLWGFGSTGKSLRAALLAHGKRPAAIFEIHPRRLGNVIEGAPVLPPEAFATQPHLPVIASIAGPEGRTQARAELRAHGREELRDFICAA